MHIPRNVLNTEMYILYKISFIIIISHTGNKLLYFLEFTLGFKTNIKVNSIGKAYKCTTSIKELSSTYNKVTFINLSMGAHGILSSSRDSFRSLPLDLNFETPVQKRTFLKTFTIAVRSSY